MISNLQYRSQLVQGLTLCAFLALRAPLSGQVPSLGSSSGANIVHSRNAIRLQENIPQLMRLSEVPGLSIALIRNAQIEWVGSFGVRKAGTDAKVNDHTVFAVASLSKPVFAYGVLTLVDQGRLDLDTPLSHYLPGYVADDRINLVTARLVLSQRTGFPNWRGGEPPKPLPIKFKPGERFSYSGEGFVYLQRVVEKITGMGLDEFMQQAVFRPLGMLHSSYLWRPDFDTDVASGHNDAGVPQDLFKPVAGGSPWKPWGDGGPSAPASLMTTAADLARFEIALMNGTGLKPATGKEMLSPETGVDASCYVCVDQPVTQINPDISWGVGIGLENVGGDRYFWHWGDNPGSVKAFMVGSRQKRDGIVILTNSDRGMMIIPDIVEIALGSAQPAFSWLRFEHYDSPRMTLDRLITAKGVETALKQFKGDFPLNEQLMEKLGYQLMSQGKSADAFQICTINANKYPSSSEAWSALADASAASGRLADAKTDAETALALDSGNWIASATLQRLKKRDPSPTKRQ